MEKRLLSNDGGKRQRRPPPAWPGHASAALSVCFLLSLCLIVWANERTAVNLVAACVALLSWFLLSRLRR